MTERILKSTIGTMEAFNRVRNDQSLAHDNPVLNYEESLLIFNHVCGALRYIRELEARTDGAEPDVDAEPGAKMAGPSTTRRAPQEIESESEIPF